MERLRPPRQMTQSLSHGKWLCGAKGGDVNAENIFKDY